MIGEINEKVTKVIENISKVYENGKSAGYNKGYREGKQSQYDLFWDAFQNNGNRTDYAYAFYNWDKFEECFKPKYDIKPIGSVSNMFATINQYTSIPILCERAGITLDFSGATNFSNLLGSNSAIYEIGVVDCSSATNLNYAFNLATSLNTIRKLIVHEGITTYTDCFSNTSLLKNITVEGTIAGTGIKLSAHTQLTHDSIMSFIYALKDYSGTSTTKTITFGTTNLAKLTDEEKAIATQKGWTLA